MSVIASLDVLISGNNSGLTSALRDSDRQIDGFAQSFSRRLDGLGQSMTRLGRSMTIAAAPLAAAFTDGVRQAMRFEESIANIGAVLGKTLPELEGMSEELRAMGAESRFGPQAVAEAMYNVVGGVVDASTHMAILTAAIHTAQAGNADLLGTTNALISVMNSYSFSADQATMVSDILTQTVAKGVGTMSQFAAAIPDAAGVAAQAGVSFNEMAAALAFITTKGFTASEAATRVRQAIVALLNPNADMEAALKAAGFASGSAALKSLGLAGAYRKLMQVLGNSPDKLQQATGSVWAMQGALAVTEDSFTAFSDAFREGADGLTEAAEAIQMSSRAAMWDVLQSKIENLRIELGNALLPALQGVVEWATPVVTAITDWIDANPQLVQGIAAVTAVVLPLGAALAALGFALSGFAVLLSPVGLVIGGVVALAAAFSANFLGIRDTVQNFVKEFETEIGLIPFYAQYHLNSVIGFFEGVWADIQPHLQPLIDWFTTTGLPMAVDFVQQHVKPLLDAFFQMIADVWELVSPALSDLFDWFVANGLPIMQAALEEIFAWAGDFIDLLTGIWSAVAPGLEAFKSGIESVFGWIVDNVIEPMVSGIEAVIDIINDLRGITPTAQLGPSYPVPQDPGNYPPGMPGTPGGTGMPPGWVPLPPPSVPQGGWGTSADFMAAALGTPIMPSAHENLSGPSPRQRGASSGGAGGGNGVATFGDVIMNFPNVTDLTDPQQRRAVAIAVMEELTGRRA